MAKYNGKELIEITSNVTRDILINLRAIKNIKYDEIRYVKSLREYMEEIYRLLKCLNIYMEALEIELLREKETDND